MSEETIKPMNLYQKIVKVMEQVGKLQKDGEIKDKSGKKMYSYLSEEQTTSTLQRAFIEFGLVMFPVDVIEDFFYVEGTQYGNSFKNPIAKLLVTYKIVDADSGQSELIHSIGYGSDNADKSSNKAMTNAFKYAQRQTFMISSGEDSDHVSSADITEKNTTKDTPNAPPKTQQQQGQTNTPPPPYNATNGDTTALATENQAKMIAAKLKAGELSIQRASDYLGYPLPDTNSIKRSDVNKLIKWIGENALPM